MFLSSVIAHFCTQYWNCGIRTWHTKYDQVSVQHLQYQLAPSDQNGANQMGTSHLCEEVVRMLFLWEIPGYPQRQTRKETQEKTPSSRASLTVGRVVLTGVGHHTSDGNMILEIQMDSGIGVRKHDNCNWWDVWEWRRI